MCTCILKAAHNTIYNMHTYANLFPVSVARFFVGKKYSPLDGACGNTALPVYIRNFPQNVCPKNMRREYGTVCYNILSTFPWAVFYLYVLGTEWYVRYIEHDIDAWFFGGTVHHA